MKKINRTLLLLAGITANLLLACSGSTDGKSEPQEYPNDSTRLEHRSDTSNRTLIEGGDSLGVHW